MMIFVLTFSVFGLAMAAMAVGVIFSNRRLRGSCGGMGGDCFCEKQGLPREGDVRTHPALGGLDLDLSGDLPAGCPRRARSEA